MAPTAVEFSEQYSYTTKNTQVPNGSPDSNQAFVLLKKGEFCYEERAIPELPSDRHVIVEIRATGLCGSDIHYWKHGEIGPYVVRNPLILGHESAGVVWKCGAAVRSIEPGDRVSIEPGIPCRACSHCKSGKYNLCADVEFAATPPHDGTLTTYYAVPEDFCYKLPPFITMEEGALLEPLSVAVHSSKLGNISFGNTVLVLGAGPIGLLCCAVARALGAEKVGVVDVVPARLEFAQKYAATTTYQMQDQHADVNASNILQSMNVPEGVDVVIDATGVQSCISTGLHAIKRGGKFIQAGLGAAEITFPVAQVCSKEASYIGSFRYGAGDYHTALKLVESGRVQLADLITHKYAFTQAEEAFENVGNRQGIKTIILGVNVQ